MTVADGRCPNCAEDEMDGGRCYYCGYHEYSCDLPDCRWCNDLPKQDKETLREAVARILAPHLRGGREFDDMPKNRVQYREWAAIGKCEYNDATQEEAFDAADAAIATMFERLREAVKETPSLTVDLIRKENYSGEHREWKKPITFPQNAEFYETVLEAIIAAAFQQENSDGR